MVKVKICGITNYEDAALAVDLGVQALGFVFAPSPRQITPEKARSIIEALPPFVITVGVFVDEDEQRIRTIADFCGLQMIQFHGNESPTFCRRFMPGVIKSFRLKNTSSLLPVRSYQGQVRALHLDTFQEGIPGGTGRTFPWRLAVETKTFSLPIILSGGLTPSNIQQAILEVRPYAVDVNSGIEQRPGKKDPVLMKQLMENIKNSEFYKRISYK
jgi:phosphoribosylanthranilate isomerase